MYLLFIMYSIFSILKLNFLHFLASHESSFSRWKVIVLLYPNEKISNQKQL